MQRDDITRAAKLRGHRIQQWYCDRASGVGERPELVRLRDDVRRGEVGRVYVYRLDRLSRSGILEIFNIVHELRSHGCRLETVGDGFTLEGPAADIVLAVWAWVAEVERATIRERMSTARRAVEANGGHWGRPSRTDRFTRDKIHQLSQKKSIREISLALKIPKSTVQRVLAKRSESSCNARKD